jgi:hypothetical protein
MTKKQIIREIEFKKKVVALRRAILALDEAIRRNLLKERRLIQ